MVIKSWNICKMYSNSEIGFFDNSTDFKKSVTPIFFILLIKSIWMMIHVGYHLPFPHNDLVHLQYIVVATNTSSLKGSRRWTAASYNGSQYYCWTISLSLFYVHWSYVLVTNSLCCKYFSPVNITLFPHKSWFLSLLLLHAFTNQNATIHITFFCSLC